MHCLSLPREAYRENRKDGSCIRASLSSCPSSIGAVHAALRGDPLDLIEYEGSAAAANNSGRWER